MTITRLSLALALVACFAAPAHASPGQKLDPAVKNARTQKAELMGVLYYVDKNGVVVGESWQSTMKAWNDATADKLRAVAVGPKRKLKAKQTFGNAYTDYTYTDGTLVRYNRRRNKILTMDIVSKGFDVKAYSAAKYKEVADWKERPYQKPW